MIPYPLGARRGPGRIKYGKAIAKVFGGTSSKVQMKLGPGGKGIREGVRRMDYIGRSALRIAEG